jgi:adenylate kinase
MAENDSTISAMIALEVDDEVLISRLLERGKTSGRVDDSNKDIIQNRISEYYKKTAILKNFYLKKIDILELMEKVVLKLSQKD